MSRHRPARHLTVALVVVILFAPVIYFPVQESVSLGRALLSIRRDAHVLRPLLRESGELPPVADVRTLRQDVETLDADLRALQRAVDWLVRTLSRQRAWPYLRQGAVLIEEGLSVATGLSTTAWWTLLRLESAVENHGQTNTASGVPIPMVANPAETVLQALREQREPLLLVRESLARVSAMVGQPKTGRGPLNRLRAYVAMGPTIVDGLLIASQALAGDQARTVLLLIQNSDELRATGGFISSIAVLRLEGPRLISMDYMNSYDVEAYQGIHPPPVPPLERHMGASMLLFRDANWSADFPTSSEVLASLYQMDMGEPVDAVVAIDTTFVRLLLTALGPIEIPQHGVTLTADNVIETAVSFWERPLAAPSIQERRQDFQGWLAHRKDFGRPFLEAGLARMSHLSTRDLFQLGSAVAEGIRSKHLLAWTLYDPTLQDDLRRAGWAGDIQQGPGDYLMVVDSNVGWNKVDRRIRREIDYRVSMTDQGPRARVCLTYRNRATARVSDCVHRSEYEDTYEGLTQQCYWNYVRVLAPLGSTLLAAEGNPEPIDVTLEDGKSCFGALVVVAPGEEAHLCLEYALPAEIMASDRPGEEVYRLVLQKQPGTTGTQVSVSIDLGGQGVVRQGSTGWASHTSRRAADRGALDHDLAYTLNWRATR